MNTSGIPAEDRENITFPALESLRQPILIAHYPSLKIIRPGDSHRHVPGAHIGDVKRQHMVSAVRQPGSRLPLFFKKIDGKRCSKAASRLPSTQQFVHQLTDQGSGGQPTPDYRKCVDHRPLLIFAISPTSIIDLPTGSRRPGLSPEPEAAFTSGLHIHAALTTLYSSTGPLSTIQRSDYVKRCAQYSSQIYLIKQCNNEQTDSMNRKAGERQQW